MDKDLAIIEIKQELNNAETSYDPFHSEHEGVAIIREEYLELEKEIFKKRSNYDHDKIRKGAIHLGAMVLRFLQDCV